MLRTPFLCIGLLFVFSHLVAQENQQYTAFGQDPTRLPDSLYRDIQSSSIVAKLDAFNALGQAHLDFGKADSVVYYANSIEREVLRLKADLPHSEDYLAQSYLLTGYGRLMHGLDESAMGAFLKGLELAIPHQSDALSLGLAISYIQKGDLNKSIPLLEKCMESSKPLISLRAKKQLADIRLGKQQYDQANQRYEALLHELEPSHTKLYLQIKLKQALILLKTAHYDRAISGFNDVSNAALTQQYYDIYIESVIQTGTCYRLKKDFDAAQIVLSTAHINAIAWERLRLEQDVLRALTAVSVAKQDYKNAYALMTQYVGVSRKIKDEQNAVNVMDLEMKYQTSVKENEILSLKEAQLIQENHLNRQKTIKNAILIGFLILLVPIIALLVLYYQKLQVQSKLRIQQEELNRQEVTSLIKDQELKLIKTSIVAQNEERARIAMELHDSIGGNLAAIKLQMASNTNNPQSQIITQIDETYQQVREISHNLAPTKLVENAFTNVVNEYISKLENNDLEEINFIPFPKEKVDDIDEPIKIALFKIIQELLTNTIKYAEASQVQIHLNVFKNTIQLLYEDDGKGFNVANHVKGLGLLNIKKRLDVFKADFNIDAALQRGTAVTIEIPI